MRVVLGTGPGKVWGEEGEGSKRNSPVKGKEGKEKKKKGVCFTSPDLRQNCHFPRLHKTFCSQAWHRGMEPDTAPAPELTSPGPRKKLRGSQVSEYLILLYHQSSAWLGGEGGAVCSNHCLSHGSWKGQQFQELCCL